MFEEQKSVRIEMTQGLQECDSSQVCRRFTVCQAAGKYFSNTEPTD